MIDVMNWTPFHDYLFYLVVVAAPDSLGHPMDTTTFRVGRYLLIKYLVARQLLPSVRVHSGYTLV